MTIVLAVCEIHKEKKIRCICSVFEYVSLQYSNVTVSCTNILFAFCDVVVCVSAPVTGCPCGWTGSTCSGKMAVCTLYVHVINEKTLRGDTNSARWL